MIKDVFHAIASATGKLFHSWRTLLMLLALYLAILGSGYLFFSTREATIAQLLATFAVVLIIKDIALWTWGAEDLVGPRAPGLSMAIEILDRRIPAYDLLLIVIGLKTLADLAASAGGASFKGMTMSSGKSSVTTE